MAHLVVRIHIPGVTRDQLVHEILEAQDDPVTTNSWVSVEDGSEKVLVDSAYLTLSRSDNSFYAFDYVDVEE